MQNATLEFYAVTPRPAAGAHPARDKRHPALLVVVIAAAPAVSPSPPSSPLVRLRRCVVANRALISLDDEDDELRLRRLNRGVYRRTATTNCRRPHKTWMR
jgi:hypothetical protein